MNCGLCGKHMSRYEIGKWKEDGCPICRDCRKEVLRKDVEKASPSQLAFLKLHMKDTDLIEEIVKELKLKEQITPTEPTEPLKCPEGEEWSDELHQCVKKKPPTPVKPMVEQIPAQPVVPVGPITIEQKVAALNDEVAKIQKQLAFIFGVIGQRPME